MNLLAVLSCLSLLLAAAAAQAPKPCKAPALMSGGFTLMTSAGVITSTGTVSFDSFAQRARLRSFVFSGNETFPVDQLMLFQQNVYYEIDWSTSSCAKKRLDASYIPMHVPKDAKLMGQVFMGSSSAWGMGVLTNTWYGDLPNNGLYSSVFTEIGCIPLTLSYYTPETGWSAVSTFNWVIGNSNAMDYVPPFFCMKAKLDESREPLNMFGALESLALRTRRE